MANYNRVLLIGNLTRDPELKYLPSNTAVCEFGLAVNRRYRDRDGNQQEETCFVDITAFGKPGEIINQYMSKGRPILIEGRLRYDSWTNQEGQKRSKLSVVAENFQFLGGRGDQDAGRGGARAAQASGRGGDSPPPYEPEPGPPSGDDIPF